MILVRHEITTGVSQGSILRPLLFNIFINDIFLFVKSWSVFCYADDNTLVAFGITFDEVTRKCQNDFFILDEWFLNNFLGLNSDKWHFMILETPNTLLNFKCKNMTIKNSASEKLSITNLTLQNTLIQHVKRQMWSYML